MTAAAPVVLSIAGSDPSGGAGIQADLRTFAALDVFGCAVVTAVTAQNSRGVSFSWPLSARQVREQLEAVLTDAHPAAAKTGMLPNAAVVWEAARAIARYRVPNLVIDPVIRAKDGARLIDEGGVRALKEKLVPLGALVTPNAAEAAALSGAPVRDHDQARAAAERILRLGCGAVLIKGGHLPRVGGRVVDVYYDGKFTVIARAGLPAAPRGTGCVLSAAIAAILAQELPLLAAARDARSFLQRALRRPQAVGSGRPSLLPLS